MRILYLGSNTVGTDHIVSDLAKKNSTINHGLISSYDFVPTDEGLYHTSVADLASGEIISLSKHFDRTVMLDQPRPEWTHWKMMQSTYKIMVHLDKMGIDVEYKDNANVKKLVNIEKMVTENPSWCIYPWINVQAHHGEGIKLCARSQTITTTDISSLDGWRNSEIRAEIKKKMLAGERLPEHCSVCYDQYEDKGVESYRQYESRDWLNQLDISDYSELDKITDPVYYEVSWGDKCNLKCRGCVPRRSTAIAREFKKFNIHHPVDIKNHIHEKFADVGLVDIDSLTRTSRVYVTGGEPAIMPETIDFMNRCIEKNRTEFELTMSTNGVKFLSEFVTLSKRFSNLNLSFSIDGYDKVNDYWRSGASWSKIVENMHRFKNMGHTISLNIVPGMCNVTNLHFLFEWLDREFPTAALYLQTNHLSPQSAYNNPNRQAVIASMKRCQQTRVYWSDGKSCKTAIDGILDHYLNHYRLDVDSLRDFFAFNDKLDEVRKVKLGDVVPELEEYRYLIT